MESNHYDKPLIELFNNVATETIMVSPHTINNDHNYIDFNMSINGNIATDCYITLNTPLIGPPATITILLNNNPIDSFRTDQNNINTKLAGLRDLPPTIIPIKTFFNKYAQNFLPLIALQHTSIHIRLTHPSITTKNAISSRLHTSHHYIDSPHHATLTNTAISKRIEQHNHQTHPINHEWIDFREIYNILKASHFHPTTDTFNHIMSFIKPSIPFPQTKKTIKIKLNHNKKQPIKDMYWYANRIQSSNGTTTIIPMFGQQRILLNGYERQKGNAAYFEHIITHVHYPNGVPHVSTFSFAVHPTQFQLSGYLGTSLIDDVELELEIEYPRIHKYEIVVCWTTLNEITYNGGLYQLKYN